MPAWDPKLYLSFAAERTRPAAELAARIDVVNPRRIIDLGCGPGNSTSILRSRWPVAEIVGLDCDSEMLAAARKSDSETTWLQGDAATWFVDRAYDVVFSNAMLQWLPDHAEVLPRWFRAVAPGGALAVQIPVHLHSPVHRHMLSIAERPEWRQTLERACQRLVTHDAAFYYDVLSGDAERIDIWETEYQHVVEGPAAILEWIRATGMRPFLEALPDHEHRVRFESLLFQRISDSYSRRRDGHVLFPFRRLFLVATRTTAN